MFFALQGIMGVLMLMDAPWPMLVLCLAVVPVLGCGLVVARQRVPPAS